MNWLTPRAIQGSLLGLLVVATGAAIALPSIASATAAVVAGAVFAWVYGRDETLKQLVEKFGGLEAQIDQTSKTAHTALELITKAPGGLQDQIMGLRNLLNMRNGR